MGIVLRHTKRYANAQSREVTTNRLRIMLLPLTAREGFETGTSLPFLTSVAQKKSAHIPQVPVCAGQPAAEESHG